MAVSTKPIRIDGRRFHVGTLNPWVILGVLVALLVVGASGIVYGQRRQLAIDTVARQASDAAGQASFTEALRTANVQRTAAEAALADAQSRASVAYQEILKGRNDALAKLNLAVHSGATRLYVNTTGCPTNPGTSAGTGGAQVSNPSGSAGGTDAAGPVRAELSGPDGDFLTSFAAECDAVSDRYARALTELQNDRATINQ